MVTATLPASRCRTMVSVLRPEDACGEPDDVGVDGDLDGGVAGAAVLPAWADAERAGQGLLPGAGGELTHPPLLARDPGAGAQGVVDGAAGIADRVPQAPRMMQLGEVAGGARCLDLVAALRPMPLARWQCQPPAEPTGVTTGNEGRPNPGIDGLM